MSDEFKLSDLQRDSLLGFIVRADTVIGDGTFNSREEWSDPELIALALRAAQLLGYEGAVLNQFFEQQFGIADVTDDDLGTWLAIIMMTDVENRIRAAAGGRN